MQIDFDAADLRAMRPVSVRRPTKRSAVDFTITQCEPRVFARRAAFARHRRRRPYHRPDAIFTVANAAVDAGNGHVLTLSDGSFHVPDTGLKPAPAVLQAKVTSSVEAIGRASVA